MVGGGVDTAVPDTTVDADSVRAVAIVDVIPEELGGVAHPRNWAVVHRYVSDDLTTLSAVAKMIAMKTLIGEEDFNKARLFCKAVGDHRRTGISVDAAIAKVVDAAPW